MTRVLVVYGSRHGGTQGIAERIGEVLRADGLDAVVSAADEVEDVRADAYVIGSGVYMGKWLKEPIEFIERNRDVIARRPAWLFSSGPLPGSSRDKGPTDPIENALGPTDGPGSGGRKKIEEVSAAINPRGHAVFLGAFDPADPPSGMAERIVRLMPAARNVLPPGDYREWDKIEAWAREIASALATTAVTR
jgi:menaquinone-dependent protoporphyrinogen oxidase